MAISKIEKHYSKASIAGFSKEQKTAILELLELAVEKYRLKEPYLETFDEIWFRVLHEVDMYIEGEETSMRYPSVVKAANWLKKYQHLTSLTKISIPLVLRRERAY